MKFLIEYITRTRPDENRAGDLLGYGAVGIGILLTPQQMISVIEGTQRNTYGKNELTGSKMSHLVLNMSDSEMERLKYDISLLWIYAEECSLVLYNIGYQVVFALHYDPGKRYHIHFAINAVNYISGHKICIRIAELHLLGRIFNELLLKYFIVHSPPVPPVKFADAPVSFVNGLEPRWSKSEDYINSFPHRDIYPSQCRMDIPLGAIPDLRIVPDYEFQGIAASNCNP